MSKLPPPLRETRWMRLRAFLRGLLLYNTVYWRRASDGVDHRASRVSRSERERRRPQVDPEVLRPRAQPRARHDGGSSGASASSPPPSPIPAVQPEAAAADAVEPATPSLTPSGMRRRRRVLRRSTKSRPGQGVDPMKVFSAPAETPGPLPGWWKRLLGGE